MGARTARNPSGKELSVCEVTLNREGQRVFGRDSLVSLRFHPRLRPLPGVNTSKSSYFKAIKI